MNSVDSETNTESMLSQSGMVRKRKRKIKIVLVGSSDVGKTAVA